jgi:hypothetical protein
VTQESKDPRDLWELMVPRETTDLKERSERKEIQETLARTIPGMMVRVEIKDRKETQECQEMLVNLATRVFLVFQVTKEETVIMEMMVPRVQQETRVMREIKVSQVPPENQAKEVTKDPRVRRVTI